MCDYIKNNGALKFSTSEPEDDPDLKDQEMKQF